MSVRPVGVLMMEDNAGEDEKIVAVPSRHITQRYDRVENHTDLPEITIKQIEHFFFPLQGSGAGQVGEDQALG